MIYNRTEIRKEVRSVLEHWFTEGVEYATVKEHPMGGNILLTIDNTNENKYDLYDSLVLVCKKIDGKWQTVWEKCLCNYFKNFWEQITEDWLCDLINDMTDAVMLHIEEPKKRGF